MLGSGPAPHGLERVPHERRTVSSEIERIDPALAGWLEHQPVFFVGTAPSAPEGRVNVSPKGLDSFRVLGEREVVYQDLTGSGIETIAHLRDNGRIVLMFCAFDGRPRIVRLHGRGTAVLAGDPRFERFAERFGDHRGRRAFVHVAVERVSSSCGFGVPVMTLEGPRDALDRWTANKSDDELDAYRRRRNAASIDGLPGYPA